jgi:hypothetical protein
MIIFIAVKIFKIKSEDKAALLNRLEKLGVHIDSNNVQDKSKLEGGQVVKWFEVTVENPETEETINSVINQSPTINTINDMEKNKTKMTKDELKEMVRQELQGVLAEKKKADTMGKLEESAAVEILTILAGVAGLGLGSAAIAKAQDILKSKKPELYKKLQSVSGAIGAADPSKNLEEGEGMEDMEDEKVNITLNEYVGADSFSLEVGEWVVKQAPKLAKWVMDSNTSGDPGQALADLGSTVVALATVGTFAVSVSLAVFKNDIVAAAKKLVGAVKGNPSATAEAADVTLDQIVADMPEDIKAKIAAK